MWLELGPGLITPDAFVLFVEACWPTSFPVTTNFPFLKANNDLIVANSDYGYIKLSIAA